jgi:hypothetical protein
MPRGAYQTIIQGPVQRLKDTARPLVIEPALVQALLADSRREAGAMRCLSLPSRWSDSIWNMGCGGA